MVNVFLLHYSIIRRQNLLKPYYVKALHSVILEIEKSKDTNSKHQRSYNLVLIKCINVLYARQDKHVPCRLQ